MGDHYADHLPIVRVLGKQQYLLASLLAMLILLPLLHSAEVLRLIMALLLTLLMIVGPLSLSARHIDFFTSLILGLVMTTLAWADVLFDIPFSAQAGRYVTVAFFLLLSLMIFRRHVFTNNEITRETLIAAVNAYICLGIMYAFGYFSLMQMNPHAFNGVLMADGSFPACVYLSFVTMTTLGYGDITPQTQVAALVCWSQALIGQLYVALTIARIVGVMVAKETSR